MTATRGWNVPDKLAIAAQGCYIDNNKTRDLPIQVLADISDMTVDACITACAKTAYRYAGVQVYNITHVIDMHGNLNCRYGPKLTLLGVYSIVHTRQLIISKTKPAEAMYDHRKQVN